MKTKEEKYYENHHVHKLSDEEIWISSSVADDTHIYDVNKAFERFKERTGIDKQKKKHISFYKYVGAAAVAVVLLAFMTVTAYYVGKLHSHNSFSDIIVEAPMGAKTRVQLPDGSMAWLNAGSQIIYSQGFGINDRTISLKGEGYFEVTKNKEKPFIIETKELAVKVLGTKFNFKNYEEDCKAIVDLFEGKVALVNKIVNKDLQYLSPNEKMTLDKGSGVMNITQSGNSKQALQWTKGNLVFDEDLLPEIIQILERSYNVKIEILKKDLETLRFYGNFDQQNYTIYDILNRFSETGRIKYFVKDNIIYLQ